MRRFAIRLRTWRPVVFWLSLVIRRPRLVASMAVGLVTWLLLSLTPLTGGLRLAAAWDVGAIVYLALVLAMMAGADQAEIRDRSAREDPSLVGDFAIAAA